jgi:hypothetical protein
MQNKGHKVSFFEWGFLFSEIIMIVLYAVCTEYSAGVHPAAKSTTDVSKIVTNDKAM